MFCTTAVKRTVIDILRLILQMVMPELLMLAEHQDGQTGGKDTDQNDKYLLLSALRIKQHRLEARKPYTDTRLKS